jgi:hypothetical protein
MLCSHPYIGFDFLAEGNFVPSRPGLVTIAKTAQACMSLGPYWGGGEEKKQES